MTQELPDRWSETHRRIETARAAIAGASEPAAEQFKAVLKTRAQILAREPEPEESAEQSIEIVQFTAAFEKYAVESRFVREVQNLKDLTPVPCTPSFIAGIINVRGQILPVIDIKRFFDLPGHGIADVHKVIIVQRGSLEVGLLADLVLGVDSVALDELQPSLPTLTGIRAGYLKGVAPGGLVILDLEKLLSDKSIIVHDQVES